MRRVKRRQLNQRRSKIQIVMKMKVMRTVMNQTKMRALPRRNLLLKKLKIANQRKKKKRRKRKKILLGSNLREKLKRLRLKVTMKVAKKRIKTVQK